MKDQNLMKNQTARFTFLILFFFLALPWAVPAAT